MTITAALTLLMRDPDGVNWVTPNQHIRNINMGVQYVHNFIMDTQGMPLQGFGSPEAGDGRNSDTLSRLLFGSQVVLETLHRVNTSALNDRWEALIYLASNPSRFPFKQSDATKNLGRFPAFSRIHLYRPSTRRRNDDRRRSEPTYGGHSSFASTGFNAERQIVEYQCRDPVCL